MAILIQNKNSQHLELTYLYFRVGAIQPFHIYPSVLIRALEYTRSKALYEHIYEAKTKKKNHSTEPPNKGYSLYFLVPQVHLIH